MPIDLFGIDIAGIIGDATAGQLRPVSVSRKSSTSPSIESMTDFRGKGKPPEVFVGEGFVDMRARKSRDGQTERAKGKVVVLIARSFETGFEAKEQDTLLIDGVTFTVGNVSSDPVEATWVCSVEA